MLFWKLESPGQLGPWLQSERFYPRSPHTIYPHRLWCFECVDGMTMLLKLYSEPFIHQKQMCVKLVYPSLRTEWFSGCVISKFHRFCCLIKRGEGEDKRGRQRRVRIVISSEQNLSSVWERGGGLAWSICTKEALIHTHISCSLNLAAKQYSLMQNGL